MNKKKFGKNYVSQLGFGAMRLPSLPHDENHVDIDVSAELLCDAFDRGINYVDTAYTYRGGESEIAVGKALAQTDKEVFLSTKFPLFSSPKHGEYRRTLEKQLKILGRESIDYYFFHALSKQTFDEIVLPEKMLDEALKAKEEGLISHICFSFHDEPNALKHIIDRAEIMEAVLVQYNIIDRRNEEMMKYAKSKGLGVAVMGPLAGGKFVVPPSYGGVRNESTANIALRFVCNNENVDIMLSGMKNKEMLTENISIFDKSTTFSAEELERLEKMVVENQMIADCYCTECCYCLPCPKGINIPYLFRILNLKRVDGLNNYAFDKYEELLASQNGTDKKIKLLSSDVALGAPPAACVACGMCEKKCPQNLQISKMFQNFEKELKC